MTSEAATLQGTLATSAPIKAQSRFGMIIHIALKREVRARALKVALVAGTVLNLINQGGKLVTLGFEELNYLQLSLTYLTPYTVSTFTAVNMQMAAWERSEGLSGTEREKTEAES